MTSSAPATTWLLVNTMPVRSTMKPEPRPSCFSRRPWGAGAPNCSRIIRVHGSSTANRRMNFVLWMVTTALLTRSTSGATVPTSPMAGAAPGGGAAIAAGAKPSASETLAAINDDAARRIIRRQGDSDFVAKNHTNAMLTKLASEVRKDLVTIFQLDTKVARRQHFD